MALEHDGDAGRAENKLTESADGVPATRKEDAETHEDEPKATVPASARDLPRPATNLLVPSSGDVSELTVTLLGDIALASSLEEIERKNSGEGGPRTPMMSVVHAVIANAGGTISIRDLAEEVRKYWNRPFPTSPYTPEEFMYVNACNSDDLRINE
ncbi:MAG: hypothetical protein V1792_13930 [Pseudomonadota bacterium]